MTSQDSDSTMADSVAPDSRREGLIGAAFVALADTLVDEYDVIDLLDRLVGYSVELLAADAAGIMLGDARSELRVVASSSEAADLMELMALQANEGPCFTAPRARYRPLILLLGRRWPMWPRSGFCKNGRSAGVRSCPSSCRPR